MLDSLDMMEKSICEQRESRISEVKVEISKNSDEILKHGEALKGHDFTIEQLQKVQPSVEHLIRRNKFDLTSQSEQMNAKIQDQMYSIPNF